MTPTEQDKELRQLVYMIQNADTTYDAIQFITADRRRVALEARIDELKKIEIGGDKIWTVDSGTDTAMLIEERIAELKAQQEEVKGVFVK